VIVAIPRRRRSGPPALRRLGAAAKVVQLDCAYPTLRLRTGTTPGVCGAQPADVLPARSTITTGTLDLLGVLSASQALSSDFIVAEALTNAAKHANATSHNEN
jgi:hypothetical protein